MRPTLTFFVFSLLVTACVNPQKELSKIPHIKFTALENPQNCLIDDIAVDVSCCNLELPENYFFGEITDIIPMQDSLLLFHDPYNKQIHIFTKNGKFVNALDKQGRGPGEYIDIESFAVNEFDSQLVVYDHSRKKLVYYTVPELKHIKTEPISKSLMASAFISPDKLLIISDETTSKSSTKTICDGVGVYDLKTRKFESCGFDNLASSIALSYPRTLSYIRGEHYYAYPDQNSVVYKITPDRASTPLVRFDFGDKNGNEEFWACNDIAKLNDMIVNNDIALMPHFFTFSEESCSFFFMYKNLQQTLFALSDWQGDKSKVYKKINIRGIQTSAMMPVGVLNESYIFLIYPHNCELDQQEIQNSPLSRMIAQKLQASPDEGTPVLLMFKPKLPEK